MSKLLFLFFKFRIRYLPLCFLFSNVSRSLLKDNMDIHSSDCLFLSSSNCFMFNDYSIRLSDYSMLMVLLGRQRNMVMIRAGNLNSDKTRNLYKVSGFRFIINMFGSK